MSAQNMMREHSIRHLPVVDQGKIVGVISQRDLQAVTGVVNKDAKHITVGMVCRGDPFIVDANTALDVVAQKMAMSGVGSALVQRDDKLVGILTTVDVCRLLSETLRELHPSPDSGQAA